MEEIKAPKKERKFLKAVGNIAKVLANELVMGIARKFIGKAIDKVGNKKQGLVIAFLLVAGISYASMDSIPYPITGNKQRLGWQSTGNGLVWRGRVTDTITKPTSYADKNVKAYLILDSVNGSLYVFKQGVWAAISGGGTTIDTTSLSNRINLKLNISDTAAMLLPYFKDSDTSLLNLVSRLGSKLNILDTATMLANYASKAYADTSGRFYARQDFTNVSSSTLTWTQSDTLVVGGTGVVQVYRNGQILLPTQYTIPSNASVNIGATAFKVGENYTVIFPRGGGGGGSGSGSLTSISGGTGITVSPNPITTTGTVSADLSVLMELTDTTLLNLTSRFAAKLNPSDTISLSNRINTKGSGTVTSIATGYGLSGGTITTTGTLLLDSSAVFTRIRDSIVDVAIGNDTIKILKQEYAPASTNVLTWTITPKFPIQLKAYILVFRNGQLLLNDQYNLSDTNKITIVSTSFKIGANYTVATVSGIGSISTGVFPNPVYPEAGIAVSTGTTWTTSITNNSSNWNTAFSDRLKWDGGSTGLTASTGRSSLGGTTIGQSMFTLSNPSSITFPRFNANNSVSSLTASEFRTAIGAGTGTVTSVTVASGTPLSINNNTTVPEISMAAATSSVNGYLSLTDWTTFNGKQNALGNASASVSGILTSTDWSTFNNKQNTLTNPITGTGTTNTLPLFTATSTLGNSVIQESSGNIGIGVAPIANLTFDVAKNILLKSGSTGIASVLFSETGTPSSTDVEFGGILRYNGSLDRMELVTRDNLGGSNVTNTGLTMDRITGNIGLLKPTTISSTLTVTGAITEGGNNVLTNLDTTSLSSRIDGKVSLSATETIGGTKTFNNLVNITNQMTISGSFSDASKLLGKNTSNNGVGEITLGTGLSLASNILTATQIDTASLSNRINNKVGLTGNETISGDKTFTNKIIVNDSSRFESNVLFKKNFGLPIVKISNANYTATTANHTIIYTTLTSNKTLTIPNASDAVGIKYTISIFDTPEANEALTIVTPSNNSFVITDGEGASVSIVGGYCTILQSDGIKWYVLSYSPMY